MALALFFFFFFFFLIFAAPSCDRVLQIDRTNFGQQRDDADQTMGAMDSAAAMMMQCRQPGGRDGRRESRGKSKAIVGNGPIRRFAG